MDILDLFALCVLFILCAAALGAWLVLGMLPGRIARARNHPQADAVSVCGWWGVITMGLLLPLAFLWAYYDPRGGRKEQPDAASAQIKEGAG